MSFEVDPQEAEFTVDEFPDNVSVDYETFPENFSTCAAHQCNVCNKIFVSYKGLTQHSILHTDSKPFVCEICGRGFRFKSNMFEHRSVHTGFTPHVCPFCGKAFRLKGNMKKHMKTHVTTKEELEAAYRPYSSNRRPNSTIPENAIIVRGCGLPYFPPVKSRNRKLQLGKDPNKWIKLICSNELLPTYSIPEKLNRAQLMIYRDHTLETLFEDAKSIEFELVMCADCKFMCGGRIAFENHIQEVHGKKIEDFIENRLYCEKCMRTFPDDEIFRQHQSYHSRVQLMIRNREIECLPASGVPIEVICYDLFSNDSQIVTPEPEGDDVMIGHEYDDHMGDIGDSLLSPPGITSLPMTNIYGKQRPKLDNPGEISLNTQNEPSMSHIVDSNPSENPAHSSITMNEAIEVVQD